MSGKEVGAKAATRCYVSMEVRLSNRFRRRLRVVFWAASVREGAWAFRNPRHLGLALAILVLWSCSANGAFAQAFKEIGGDCGPDANDQVSSRAGTGSGGSPNTPFSNVCRTSIGQFDFPRYGSLFGGKRMMDSGGNLRGPIYSVIKSLPPTFGDYGVNPKQAFNADFSHVPIAIETDLLDSALGDPSEMKPPIDYLWGRTSASIYIRAFNTSGVNNSNSHGANRTGYGSILIDFNNASHNSDPDKIGGDMSPLAFNGFASTARPHATSFLANPAITGVAGQLKAGVNGVWMEPYGDLNCIDGGFDAACLSVINLKRDNATGELNANFVGTRNQSIGGKPIDAFFSAAGPGVTGLDLTAARSDDHVLMVKPMIATGGSGYKIGDKLAISGGECDQRPVVQVARLDDQGGVAGIEIERRGMCSGFPRSPAQSTGGHGAGAAFEVSAAPQIAIEMSHDNYIFGNSTCDRAVFGSCFPSTVTPGASYFGYSSPMSAWHFVANGASSLEVGQIAVTSNQMFVAKKGITQALREVRLNDTDLIDRNNVNGDYVVVWRAKAVGEKTELLPSCGTGNNGRTIIVKDGVGDAAAHPITVKVVSGTVEGAAAYEIASNHAAVQLECDGQSEDWVKIN